MVTDSQLVLLVVAIALVQACAKEHKRDCTEFVPKVTEARLYRIDATASKDCLSADGLSMPNIAAYDGINAIVENLGESAITTEAVFKGCSAHVAMETNYASRGLLIEVDASGLSVEDDGSLRGPGTLELRRGTTVECKASLALVLTPLHRDAGL